MSLDDKLISISNDYIGKVRAGIDSYALGDGDANYEQNQKDYLAQIKQVIYQQLWERREAYNRTNKVTYAVPIEVLEDELK